MNKKLETQIKEIAEFNIPDNTNIWQNIQIKFREPINNKSLRIGKILFKPALLILTGLVFLFSIPAARAYLEKVIGGAVFNITGEYPGSLFVRTVPVENIPIAQILEEYPFEMPTYAPQGYELQEEARVTEFHDFESRPAIQLKWDDFIPGTRHIFLNIFHNNGVGGEPVGPDSLELIEIAGHEVALITGGWYQNTQEWNYDISLRLKWEQNGLLYDLSYSDTVPFEEIIKMVTSIIESGD